jgi:hypothetical protein
MGVAWPCKATPTHAWCEQTERHSQAATLHVRITSAEPRGEGEDADVLYKQAVEVTVWCGVCRHGRGCARRVTLVCCDGVHVLLPLVQASKET